MLHPLEILNNYIKVVIGPQAELLRKASRYYEELLRQSGREALNEWHVQDVD